MSVRESDLVELDRVGRSALRRLAKADAAIALERSAARCLGPLLAGLAVDAIYPLPFSPAWPLWGAGAAWCAASCARAWARKRPIAAVLARVDLDLGLRELLSTAYQESRRAPGSEFAGLLARRGAEAARNADLSGAFRAKRPSKRRPWRLLLGYCAALALSFTGPAYRLSRDPFLPLARSIAALLDPAQKKLETAGLREPAERLKELRRKLAQGRLSREQALRALDELDRTLGSGREDGSGAEAGEMARAGAAMKSKSAEPLSRALRSADPGAAARALESLAKDSEALDSARREELGRELARAAEELSKTGPLGEARCGLESAAKPFKGLEKAAKGSAAASEARAAVGEARAAIGRAETGGASAEGPKGGGSGPSQTGPPKSEGGSGEGKSGPGAPGGGGGKGGLATPSAPSGGGGGEAGGPGGSSAQPLNGFRRLEAGPGPMLTVPGRTRGAGTGTPTLTRGLPERGAAAVPYTELLPGYKAEAEDAMRKEAVPPGYRGMIRDYFQLLDPKSRKKESAAPRPL